jgi:SAM-dependent methyltransferase
LSKRFFPQARYVREPWRKFGMNETKGIRLNIGAGETYIPGYINIDISRKADITLDLGKDKLPFDDDSVDLIFSYHTLEHVPDYLFALSEIHRVLRHGGHFLVGLPYVTLTEYHLVNPYHLHSFNEFSFDFFDAKMLKGSAAEENPILFNKVFHRFHYIGVFNLFPPPFRSWCRRHLFNVVRKIDYGLIAIKKPGNAVLPNSKQTIIRQFDECLRSRVPYGKGETAQNKKRIRHPLKRIHKWWLGCN